MPVTKQSACQKPRSTEAVLSELINPYATASTFRFRRQPIRLKERPPFRPSPQSRANKKRDGDAKTYKAGDQQ